MAFGNAAHDYAIPAITVAALRAYSRAAFQFCVLCITTQRALDIRVHDELSDALRAFSPRDIIEDAMEIFDFFFPITVPSYHAAILAQNAEIERGIIAITIYHRTEPDEWCSRRCRR